ncbi:hypothetical protein U1Q18_031983 [Sarracenia purpurea var. burkii]
MDIIRVSQQGPKNFSVLRRQTPIPYRWFHGSARFGHDSLLLRRFIDVCSALGLSHYYGCSAFNHHQQRTNQQSPPPPPPGIYLYNNIIRALSRHTHSAKEAILVYNNIQAVAGLRPDTYSFPFALKAVVRLCAVEVGREIHCQAVGTGLDSDVHVLTALIQMYASCGCVADARKLFDRMLFRDVASWNAIIAGYVKIGNVDSARDLFERMPLRNVISWTSVIAGIHEVLSQLIVELKMAEHMRKERWKMLESEDGHSC